MIASGTMLTPKIHRQFSASTNTPPSSGPTTKAVPVQAVQVPIARAWAAPEKRALIIASELGTKNAAPTPCRQRAATSTQPVGADRAQHRGHRENREARPQHREPAELVGDGARNEDQRAEAEQIAVDHPLLQRQPASPCAKSRPMAGNARLTTDPSRNATNEASTATAMSGLSVSSARRGSSSAQWASGCVTPGFSLCASPVRASASWASALRRRCAWMARCAARMAR